jgi:hypothetical protein
VDKQRISAGVEERLDLVVNVLSPRILEVLEPPPNPIVPSVDGPTDRGNSML